MLTMGYDRVDCIIYAAATAIMYVLHLTVCVCKLTERIEDVNPKLTRCQLPVAVLCKDAGREIEDPVLDMPVSTF
jgi:hypothetical protein